MEFSFNNESLGLLKNIFSFFGTVNSDFLIETIDGRIFEKISANSQDLVGQNFTKISYWHPLSEQQEKKINDTILDSSNGIAYLNLDFKLNSREKMPVELFLQPVSDKRNNLQHIFFCGFDVTSRKIEQSPVSEEISKIYENEKKAREEAREANRAKDFFLAVVSHELRSPLNTILGWSKILLTKEINEATRRNALETIEKSARAQARLIDDLVDSSRIASGKLRLEFRRVNLFEILKTVYDLHKSAAENKNINLEFYFDKENILLFGDSSRLQQIFTNLVSNALKFTPKGGHIRIDAQTSENQVKVFVKDSGQGISPELLARIFGQSKQDDEKTPLNRSGLGLGLSTVKILSEKHNGTIQVESKGVNKGSIFTVVLPLFNDEEETSASQIVASKEISPLNGINILVVEDDADSREVLQLFLEQSGAIVKSAAAAAPAIEFLKNADKSLPDIIISDLAMPEEDGFSLLSRIRKLPVEKGGSIPAIALSAFASKTNKKQAYENGFQKYHTKPFEPDGIVRDILGLVNK